VIFSFRGIVSAFDPRSVARSDRAFMRLRRVMTEELGLSATRADRLLDEMLLRALTRWGDDVIRGRSAVLDRVVDLRNRLDNLYHEILSFNNRTGTHSTARVPSSGRSSVRDQLREIDQLIQQLDAELATLGQPLENMLPSSTARRDVVAETSDEISRAGRSTRRPGHEHRDVAADTVREVGRRRSRLARKGFVNHPPGQDTTFRRTFSDGSWAEFTIEGGRYRVRTRDASGVEIEFAEYDILRSPYASRPLTTSLMQAHHGMQNSLMTRLFSRFGYSGEAAPTIWLRNSRRGSPHGAITAVQNSTRSTRASSRTTLSDIRRWAIEDLRLTHMPEDRITQYLREFDEYFARTVLPQMSAADRSRFLGDWRPPSGTRP